MNSANEIKKSTQKSEPPILKKNPEILIQEKKQNKPIKKQPLRQIISEPKLEPPKKQAMKKSLPVHQKQMEEMQRTIDQLK